MLLPVGSEVLWILFFSTIQQVIFYPKINCHPFKSDSAPVVEIIKVPNDVAFDDEVAFRYSLKHDKVVPNKKYNILPEKVRDNDTLLEYSYKCPDAKKSKGEHNMAQLVAVIYRKMDTSANERVVTFYLPGPATLPVFREMDTECPTNAPPPCPSTTYEYKGCGGE